MMLRSGKPNERLCDRTYHVKADDHQTGFALCGEYLSQYCGDVFAKTKAEAKGTMCKRCERSL